MKILTPAWKRIMFINPSRCFAVVAAVALWAPVPTASAGEIIEGIVAHVGNEVVLLSDVKKRVARMEQSPNASQMSLEEKEALALSSLIDDRLVAQEVKRLKIDVSEAEVDGVVKRMGAQNQMNPAQFQQALEMQGITMKQYRQQIKDQLIKMRLVQSKVKNEVQIPDEDVRALYRERTRMTEGVYKLRASHILFKLEPGASAEEENRANDKVQKVLAELAAGAAFDAMAKQYSEGPSAPQGGDLGFFGPGQMVPAFEKAAYAAEVKTVTGPVRTPFGMHLIWVADKLPMEKESYEKVAPVLRQELTNREMERLFRSYINNLREKSWISRRDAVVK